MGADRQASERSWREGGEGRTPLQRVTERYEAVVDGVLARETNGNGIPQTKGDGLGLRAPAPPL